MEKPSDLERADPSTPRIDGGSLSKIIAHHLPCKVRNAHLRDLRSRNRSKMDLGMLR